MKKHKRKRKTGLGSSRHKELLDASAQRQLLKSAQGHTQKRTEKTRVEEKSLRQHVSHVLSWLSVSLINAKPFACFNNALRLFMCGMPEKFTGGGSFVEGFFVVEFEEEGEIAMNEHGWCEQADGTIIDPLVYVGELSHRSVYYFVGVRRSWREVKELVQGEGKICFPYVRFDGMHGEDGMGHSLYSAAYEAACQKVEFLASQSSPPKAKVFLKAQDESELEILQALGVEVIVLEEETS